MRTKPRISSTAIGAAAVLLSLTQIAQVPTGKAELAVSTPSASIAGHGPLIQADAKKMFDDECASCHGKQGRGNGRAGRDMDPRPTDITKPEFLDEHSDEDMFKKIIEGDGEMDPYRDIFTDEQIHAIIAYTRQLGEKRRK